jgi:hypothetical protein
MFVASRSYKIEPIDASPEVAVSLVVPAYNEEDRLGVMLDPTLAFMKEWCKSNKSDFEV